MIGDINQLNQLLKANLKLALSISFGVFLFLIFYEPFDVAIFDYNNWLIFKAGLSVIVFILIFIVRVGFPWFIKKDIDETAKPEVLYKLGGVILFVLCSVSFTFYLYYIGQVDITFDVMLNVAFICIVPSIVLWLNDRFKRLIIQNESLYSNKKLLEKKIEKYEADIQNTSIELISDSGVDVFETQLANILVIQSADNYVEIFYKEGEDIKKKLLRNTLRNIESQLESYSNFVRCHRSFLVNTLQIEKLQRDENKNWLTIKGFNQKIPVSRHYLIILKDFL